MFDQDANGRAIRARNSIATYNLKALFDNAMTKQLNPVDKIGAQNQNSEECAVVSDSPPQIPLNSSDPASPLSLPQSKYNAWDSLENEGVLHECFNPYSEPKGHVYATRELYQRGVWIGYLDKSRHSESYCDLPSFKDLKDNYVQFSMPRPEVIQGIPGDECFAVCRGCISANSMVMSLAELQFYKNTKVVVLPLDGDDKAGTFCILTRHSDRSLKGLQAYRPYQISNSTKRPNTFTLLALRNPSRDADTLGTVLNALSPDELLRAQLHVASRQIINMGHGKASTSPELKPLQSRSRSATLSNQTFNDNKSHQSLARQRKSTTHAQERRRLNTLGDLQDTDMAEDDGFNLHSLNTAQANAEKLVTLPQCPVHIFSSPPVTPMKPHPLQEIRSPSIFTGAQARRTNFVWTILEDGVSTDIVHSLHECKTFKGLLELFREDAHALPSAAPILESAKMWLLNYDEGDGNKKAILAHTGTETGFNRLCSAIALSPIRDAESRPRIDIEVVALSKSIAATAASSA
ncbi:hypothetical protein ACN47E_005679 [Coniothyrium glycines]